ncbi:MAG: hypothetical protein ABH830_00705, partial [Patescibacteria group bacterium]
MDNWPIYYKDLLKLGNPNSPVGIATLWTICDKIIQDIDKNLYCLAGQLYTKNGINYLIRNLLANKKIRYLIVCGQDRSGSGEELKKIWQEKKSEILHKEINPNSLSKMINNVTLIDLSEQENCQEIKTKIKQLDLNIESYGENETFPDPAEIDLNELNCSWPTDNSIFKVTGKSIAHTWLKALKTILKFGDIKHTDAMKIKEVCNLTAVINDEDPENFFIPDYLNITQQKIKEYIPQIIKGEKING